MWRSHGQKTARSPGERQGNPPHPEEPPAATGGAAGAHDTQAQGVLVVPVAAAAALDPSVFSRVNAAEAIPSTWEERARKAWKYYVEEPLVKNCVNSWRTFAVADEIKITSDDEYVKWEAIELADRLGVSAFVKDLILQLEDQVEPGVDHSGLKGKALIAAKKKHHIGPLKNKQQLIKALLSAWAGRIPDGNPLLMKLVFFWCPRWCFPVRIIVFDKISEFP